MLLYSGRNQIRKRSTKLIVNQFMHKLEAIGHRIEISFSLPRSPTSTAQNITHLKTLFPDLIFRLCCIIFQHYAVRFNV